MTAEQIVDPAASRRQGWLLLDATFPKVFVVFAATKLKPSALVAGVVIDFTDYDLRPPSVRFVDLFTRDPLKAKDLTFRMMRRIPVPAGQPAMIMLQGMGVDMPMPQIQVQDLIQANSLDDKPFLCLPGIREYHDNPAHTGDPWLLHRASGERSLGFMLEKIWTYGVNPIEDYAWQLKVQVLGSSRRRIRSAFRHERARRHPDRVGAARRRDLDPQPLARGRQGWVRRVGVVGRLKHDTHSAVTGALIPAQRHIRTADGVCVVLGADDLHQVNVQLFKNKLTLAQIHSHPGAYHSTTDD